MLTFKSDTKMKIFNSLFVILTSLVQIITGQIFDYTYQAEWLDEYVECNKNYQSPIELNSLEAILSVDTKPLVIKYNTTFALPVSEQNNGHTDNIQLTKPSCYNTTNWQEDDRWLSHISGGMLPGDLFIAESVHFHWGSNYTHGSEHVIDGVRYAMEMHILHRNIKYQTVAEAQAHKDGLAVVALLFAVNVSKTEGFEGLDPVIKSLKAVARYEAVSNIEDFNLLALLGDINQQKYFTYNGSLTTPPCSRTVTWIVFSDIKELSKSQMDTFYSLRAESGTPLLNNYRALQPKGFRKVYLVKERQVIQSHIESSVFEGNTLLEFINRIRGN